MRRRIFLRMKKDRIKKNRRRNGLSGRDDSLLQCTKQENKDGYDLEFVGKVESVNTKLLESILDLGITPVVSPIGTGINEESNVAYNVSK